MFLLKQKDSLILNEVREECFHHIPGSLTGICAVDVTQLAKAEAIPSRWVNITIHGYNRAAGGHLEHFPYLNIHFKVGDRAPKLWSCNDNRH